MPGVYTPVYQALEEVGLIMEAGTVQPPPVGHAWLTLRYGNRPQRVFVDLPSVLYDEVFWNWCHYNHRLRLMAIRFRDVQPLIRFPDCLVDVDLLRVMQQELPSELSGVHIANLRGCLPRARILVADLPRAWHSSIGELVSVLCRKVMEGGTLVLNGIRVEIEEASGSGWAEVVDILCALIHKTPRTYLDLYLQTASPNQCPHCTSPEHANPQINQMFNRCMGTQLETGPRSVQRMVHQLFQRGSVLINIRVFHVGCGRECTMTPTANRVLTRILRQLWAFDHHSDVGAKQGTR